MVLHVHAAQAFGMPTLAAVGNKQTVPHFRVLNVIHL
jgi:hypothetical protein